MSAEKADRDSNTVNGSPSSHLAGLPDADLRAIAAEIGLEPREYRTRDALVAAIHDRRRSIEQMDRRAMLEVLAWGRRSAPPDATREHLAHQIVTIRRMDFEGLSSEALRVLAALRGVNIGRHDSAEAIIRKLRRKEGLLGWLNRKRKSLLGHVVEKVLGSATGAAPAEPGPQSDAGSSASQQPASQNNSAVVRTAQPVTVREDIEESGLFGGIANRIKRTADAYLNQKLDEIEARIDRKIDEIDRRLGEWRDKELHNRLRILKITLWASVIVALISLLYSWIKVYVIRPVPPQPSPPAATRTH